MLNLICFRWARVCRLPREYLFNSLRVFLFFIVLLTACFAQSFAQNTMQSISDSKIVRLRREKNIFKFQMNYSEINIIPEGVESQIELKTKLNKNNIQKLIKINSAVKIPEQNKFYSLQIEYDKNNQLFHFKTSSITSELLIEKDFYFKGSILLLGKFEFIKQDKAHTLLLKPNNNQGFDLIEYIPERKYITGVVYGEMGIHWPLEAIKAQTIIAHTYLLFQKIRRQMNSFDVDATVQDQVYRSTSSLGIKQFKSLNLAVNEVFDYYLIDNETQRAIPAYYHSHCGGATRSAKAVWGMKSYGTAKDKNCENKFEWSYTLTKENNEDKLIYQVSTPAQAEKMRQIIGFDKLRSPNFHIENNGVEKKIVGTGYGHGVGLCQWGTKKMAEQGANYEQILNHYYPLAKLQKDSVKQEKLSENRKLKKALLETEKF